MVLFGNWFRKSQREDYEQVLALLALDIQKRQERLSEIRLRERRSTLLFSIYALSSWVAYLSLWYTDLVPTLSSHARYSKFEKSVEAIPVFAGPIVILFIRRIAQIWYTKIGDKEEKHLVALRKQQKEKIAEIKKKTNYDTTRNLIERYDDALDSPLRRRVPVGGQPVTPQGKMPAPQPQRLAPTPAQVPPSLQQQLSPMAQQPMPPPRKHWYDKVADAILGDDDTITAASSRYALICQKCFAHNGLVKESAWEETRACYVFLLSSYSRSCDTRSSDSFIGSLEYTCPKCGYFNPAAKALRQARTGGRPSVSPPRQPQFGQPLAPPLEHPSSIEDGPNLDPEEKEGSEEEHTDVAATSS
ncbi:uncharacterized protein PHACADRAFT_26705 [Phanerochaete carnosa HHB-10118-sp]|uniref:Endoplasmic reticulum junction formation protein lunapark n=1 Tax=Phanerochaete carnosa (strain HHB-10118-sp) TaxID=650164 RepID=K5W2S1_PHACS|nr:uncharacterized protein PHACADRAFT_26705 [Phanerochaete carnosa HHB-10118-sp]EKM58183.1 hypothetical protein PHACADRAFT_26705 [Phanerochaete carnosa HHB-10118-sp]